MSDSVQKRVVALLIEVAPDIDPQQLLPDVELRDQIDFDSMDTLNFAAAIKREFGVDVPDTDFRELVSVTRCTQYLRTRMQDNTSAGTDTGH